jgi:hypothetical protein
VPRMWVEGEQTSEASDCTQGDDMERGE